MIFRDYHIHSHFSPDSKSAILSIALTAMKKGLTEIAICDHFDPTANDPDCLNEYDPKAYFDELYAVRQMVGNQIKILAGVEAGQAQLYPESIKKLFKNYKYDFVLGSVHNTTGDVDLAFAEFTKDNYFSWLQQYFSEAEKAADTALYDVFAHICYPVRYMNRVNLATIAGEYEELAVPVLKKIIEHGKGLEINTSGLRFPSKKLNPLPSLLKKYKSLGGEILTIGSDAHFTTYVGLGIPTAIVAAKDAGFRYIAYYRDRKPYFEKI